MRREEGLLFGNAWLSHWENSHEVADHCKSVVRLRLGRWDQGGLESWQRLEQKTVFHPETQQTKFQVGPHAYLAFGPLDGRKGTQLKRDAAIQAEESATLSLAYPEESATLIDQALWLMHRYGSVGGRSRNGWGSYELTPVNGTPPLSGKLPLRNWCACLDRDWPHAIGHDEKAPLIWQTTEHDDWQQLMRTLAIIKIGLRTQFVFPSVKPPHPSPLPRHWLSYPITHHTTTAFDRNARLPNSLRFKVRRQGEKKLVGVIFHMPCLPPAAFSPHRAAIEKTWKTVYDLLDELTRPVNKRGYGMIADATRRTALKPGLDTVTLNRIPE
jgi:CRISPR-associated protein Cmr1